MGRIRHSAKRSHFGKSAFPFSGLAGGWPGFCRKDQECTAVASPIELLFFNCRGKIILVRPRSRLEAIMRVRRRRLWQSRLRLQVLADKELRFIINRCEPVSAGIQNAGNRSPGFVLSSVFLRSGGWAVPMRCASVESPNVSCRDAETAEKTGAYCVRLPRDFLQRRFWTI